MSRPVVLPWDKMARFLDVGGDGCWEWQGAKTFGYGYMGAAKANYSRRVHRFVYETLRGPIPDGLVIDHLCRNRGCAKPSHLEVVTPAVNTWRSEAITTVNAGRLYCPQGHPYAGTNLYMFKKGVGRACRICRRAARRKYEARKREERYGASIEKRESK